ncbi:hypothetical protein ACROYT_G006928, partial [Oculina patagonica]
DTTCKMASKGKSADHFAEFVGNEIACPVCLEIFDDPKCLPNCAHNVCVKCLENLAKRNRKQRTIQCPECRVKSTIPASGVRGFPTNHLLKRLIDNSPEKKERRAFSEALKQYREQINGMREEFQTLATLRSNVIEGSKKKMKDQIKAETKRLTKVIEAEQKKLLSQVDEMFGENSAKNQFGKKYGEVKQLYAKVSTSLETADKIAEEHDWKKFQKSKDIFEEQFQDNFKTLGATVGNLRSLQWTTGAKFTPGNMPKSGKILGEISCSAPNEGSFQPVNSPRNGRVIRHIDTDFVPTALTVSPVTGEIAVLDAENKRVHVFTPAGDKDKQFDIKSGDLKEIAYSKNNDIVVLNQEKNRLLHFDKDGAFIHKFVQAPNRSVRFQKMAMDVDGRYVLTSKNDTSGPGIVVYDAERCHRLAFTSDHFRGNNLAAVHYKDKYFVADCTSTIKIFDNKGKFLQETTYLGGKSTKLLSLAVDSVRDSLVCSSDKNTILVVKTDGRVVTTIPMGGHLNAVAMSKGCNSLVACFHEKKFIQILSHKE